MQGSVSLDVKQFDAQHPSRDIGQASIELPTALGFTGRALGSVSLAEFSTSTPVNKPAKSLSVSALQVDPKIRETGFVTPVWKCKPSFQHSLTRSCVQSE